MTTQGLRLVLDGIIYQRQSHGGISRLYSEILPRMCSMEESLNITIVTNGSLRQSLPHHPHITHRVIPRVERYLRPGRVWKPLIPQVRRMVQRLWIGDGKGQIWHSTYYTQPENWDGAQVVTVHDMIRERFPKMFNRPTDVRRRRRKQRCVTRADAIICVSKVTRRDLQRFYDVPSQRVHVIPHACSSVFKRVVKLDSSVRKALQPFLLYIGSRYPYKNFDRLLQAYSGWKYRDEIALVVVGRPGSAEVKQRIAELKIRDRVRFLTDVDDRKLCELYNLAAAFVYPSLYEGFGIPLLEAMACGCPIVASHIPSTLEVAGSCPIYFEPTETNSLNEALDRALEEGRNSPRVQRGLQLVKQYSWDKTSRQTLEVYHGLLKS